MTEPRSVVWISAGAASAVAAKLSPGAVLAYCDTGAEHEDNARFLTDCERWLERPIERLKSDKFDDTWDVWTRERYLSGIAGAPCTRALKVAPRLAWQRPDDIHVFGYTCDAADINRADSLREHYPDMAIETPLIDRGIDKAACLAIIARAGIALPPMYLLGFQNNNCIPCSKATSPAYWALVRLHFPDKFWRMARLSRELGVRLAVLRGERIFIDEIPLDYPTNDPIQPACDLLCQLAEQDMGAT